MEERKEYYQDDEITLKELILKIQEYAKEVMKNWWVVGLFCLVTTSYFMYKHFTHVPEYKAELRFVVEGQGGVGGGLGGLLGSFGIKKGGSVNPYKILEVGKSSKIFEEVIFSEYNQDSTIADKILAEYDLVEKWAENNPEYEGFKFSTALSFSKLERKIIKKLSKINWGDSKSKIEPLTSFNLDEEKGIYTIESKTTDENLSLVMAKDFYDRIKLFFEEEVFKNQKQSADILSAKADSINNVRKSKIYQLARFDDSNRGSINSESSSKKAVLSQEIQALGLAYSELIKNYEMTDVNLKDLQPLFMKIEVPYAPISPTQSSLLRNLLYGILLGGFLSVLFLISRKVYRDIINE